MTEAALARRVLALLRALPQTWAIKVHGSIYQDAGTPDILGCHRGQMFALELKLPGKKPTPVQARTLARWEEAGAIAALVTSAEEALEAIGATQEARS
jgi:hypothetical protein